MDVARVRKIIIKGPKKVKPNKFQGSTLQYEIDIKGNIRIDEFYMDKYRNIKRLEDLEKCDGTGYRYVIKDNRAKYAHSWQ